MSIGLHKSKELKGLLWFDLAKAMKIDFLFIIGKSGEGRDRNRSITKNSRDEMITFVTNDDGIIVVVIIKGSHYAYSLTPTLLIHFLCSTQT